MRKLRAYLPVALCYLLLSQEALAVRTNIRATKAFIGSARIARQDVSRRTNDPQAAFGSRVVTMMAAPEQQNKKNSLGSICPSKLTALGVSGFSLLTGATQAAKADVDVAPPVQVCYCVLVLLVLNCHLSLFT